MKRKTKSSAAIDKAKEIIRNHGGVIHTSVAIRASVHPRIFYTLYKKGVLEQISRGVYRLTELPAISMPDLVTAALLSPKGIICLISALSYHEITTQIPHKVSVALEEGTRTPRIDFPPVQVYRFNKNAYHAGIEVHKIDSIDVKIYSPEKTLADCFKFREKIGMDVVLEALKLYRTKKRFKVDDIMKYARICRVEKIMRPYLEALI
jgi:predicted transcriptional regulator of viral defense system